MLAFKSLTPGGKFAAGATGATASSQEAAAAARCFPINLNACVILVPGLGTTEADTTFIDVLLSVTITTEPLERFGQSKTSIKA